MNIQTEGYMNKKVTTLGIVMVSAVLAFAQAPATAPAAQPAEAPAVAAEAPAEPAPAAEAPAPAPSDVVAAPVEQPGAESAPVVQEAPVAEPVEAQPAPVVESDLYGDMPAPVAVRGVDASTGEVYGNPAPAVVRKPAPRKAEYRPSRERVPMKFTFGAQGFIGMNTLYEDNDYNESYSGVAWKVGAFALFPLNEYMMGFKIGALYDHSDASGSYLYDERESKESYIKFVMDRISVPMLFVLKSPYASFTVDFGALVSIPVRDIFHYKKENSKGELEPKSADMMAAINDKRNSADFALLLGITIKANRYMSFDIRYEYGFSKYYSDVDENDWRINDITSSTLLLGFSFYAL